MKRGYLNTSSDRHGVGATIALVDLCHVLIPGRHAQVGIFNCSNAVERGGVGEGSVTRKRRRARKLREGTLFQ